MTTLYRKDVWGQYLFPFQNGMDRQGRRNKIMRNRPEKKSRKSQEKKEKKRKYMRSGQDRTKRPKRIGTSGEIRRASRSTVNLDR